MVELAQKVPDEVFLGQSLEFKLRFAEYDPATWTGTMYLQSATGKQSIIATNDGGLFSFFLGSFAADTGGSLLGDIDYFVQMVAGARRNITARGQIKVLPDPTGAATDFRSQVKRTLDKIRAVMEGAASRDDQSYTISTENGSRSLSRFSHTELLQLEKTYAARYAEEIRRAKRRSGKKSGRVVKSRFSRG